MGGGVEYCFGHYVPFLGAFFGINMLFGTWDGVYGKLYTQSSDEAKRIEKKWEEDTATRDVSDAENNALRKKRRWNTRSQEWIKTGGRLIGLTTAAAIAAAFFFVPRNTLLPWWWMDFVMALPAFFPALAVLFMWFNNRGLKKIRNQENEILRQAGQISRTIDAAADDKTIDTVAERITSPQRSEKT